MSWLFLVSRGFSLKHFKSPPAKLSHKVSFIQTVIYNTQSLKKFVCLVHKSQSPRGAISQGDVLVHLLKVYTENQHENEN